MSTKNEARSREFPHASQKGIPGPHLAHVPIGVLYLPHTPHPTAKSSTSLREGSQVLTAPLWALGCWSTHHPQGFL